MFQLIASGNTGRDAEYKQTQNGNELCSFPLAATVGFGDNKQTYWVDVTKWGKGAKGLSEILRKGSRVSVLGELTTREHNGKTYLQCRASEVTILGTPNAGTGGALQSQREPVGAGSTGYDDLDDEVPFLGDGFIR